MIRLSVMLFWLSAAGAVAQPADRLPEGDLPEEYVRAVDLGVDEMDRGNFEEARSRFLQAHDIYPNARTLRALGKVAYELKHYRSAVEYLEQSLETRERPLTDELRQDVQALLRQAREYVGSCTLIVDPESAQLRLDGTAVELGADRRLTLDVGRHIVEARAPGYQPARRELLVAGGREHTLALRLLPQPGSSGEATGVVSATATRGTRSDKPLRQRWWVWTGVGGVVAAAVVSGVVLSMRHPAERTNGGNSATEVMLR